jgi:hypothetical protein
MSVVFGRITRSGRRGAFAAMWLVAGVIAAPPPAFAQTRDFALSDTVAVVLDQATLMKLPPGVATLVVGNPLIADVSIQAGGLIVVTGKGFGATNLLALDRSGAVLTEKTIQVQGPRDNLVVMYRGVERETYSCTPKCDPRITLGDSATYFGGVLGQSSTRTGQAQAGGVSAAK